MFGTAAEANVVLEKLGSDYRAGPNQMIGPAVTAILDAIPGYIDRLVDKKLEDYKDKLSQTDK